MRRTTFTLTVEYRGDMRGHEQRTVTENIQAFAEKQSFQTFAYESGNKGTYAFKAHPDYIDLQRDAYEMDAFRDALKFWLDLQVEIDNYTLQAVTALKGLYPRMGDSKKQDLKENFSNREKLFRAIK